jgi:hypothetical protein
MSILRLESDRGLGALGGVCAALALVILGELIAGPGAEPIDPAPSPPPAAKAESSAQGVPAMSPLGQFSEVVERNLFSETRRARESDTDAGASAARTVDAQLVGIVISDENESVALFRVAGSNEFLRVTKGQSVRGRRVAAILPDRVVLLGDEPNEIKLQETEAAGMPPELGGRPQPGRARPAPPPAPPAAGAKPAAGPKPAAGAVPDRGVVDLNRARGE